MGIIVLLCCDSGEKDGEPRVLVRVGERVITADEFTTSFELAFAPLRMGKDPRRTYLDFLISELLLANEGYANRLHEHPYVQNRLARRRYFNLLESFYRKHVYAKVRVSEDLLRQATLKSTVKWRMLIWPLPSLEQACEALVQARETNLADYVEKQLDGHEVKLAERRFYETDWIDFLDLRPEIHSKIKDLQIGQTSDPIPFAGGYALVQILDLQLHGITEEELQHGAMRKRMQARLCNIQADSIGRALMDSVLTPLNIHVKGAVLEKLAPLLHRWVADGLPEDVSLVDFVRSAPDTAAAYILELKNLLEEPLLTCRDGVKPVSSYLEHMNYFRRTLKGSASLEDFKIRLITEIGTMIKNEIYIKMAEAEGWADSTAIVRDLELWEQKWTFQLFRHYLVSDIEVTEQEKLGFFQHRWRELDIADVDTARYYKYDADVHNAILHEKQLQRLRRELAELKEHYSVWVDEELLEDIELSDSPKALSTTLFLRSNFSGHALTPTADMSWVNL